MTTNMIRKIYIIESREDTHAGNGEEAPRYWRLTENKLWQPVCLEYAMRFDDPNEATKALQQIQKLGHDVWIQVNVV